MVDFKIIICKIDYTVTQVYSLENFTEFDRKKMSKTRKVSAIQRLDFKDAFSFLMSNNP